MLISWLVGEILRCAQDDNRGQEPDPSLRSG